MLRHVMVKSKYTAGAGNPSYVFSQVQMNSSRGAANSAVLDCLERAGSIGVHIDDLTKYLGFEEKKHILPRLYDLQARGFVDRVPGQKWKIVKSDLANSGISPKELALTDQRFQRKPPGQETDARGLMPKVQSPPKTHVNAGFISCKNSLQEYCQKNHLPVPKYTTEREQSGYISTVIFGSSQLKSKTPMLSVKQAEQQVAYEALTNANIFNAELAQSTVGLQEKRNATTPIGPSGPPQKMRISEEASESYKSKLNEYTQRLKLEAVKYEINECAEGFVATAIVQGRCFSSARPADRRKQAEQSAAYAVLVGLGELPIAGTRSKPLCTASAVSHPAAALANRNGHSSIRMKPEFISPDTSSSNEVLILETTQTCETPAPIYKNKLQEHLQRRRSPLPSYDTIMDIIDGLPGFRCFVTVEGFEYPGGAQKSKKEAEQDAARVALIALGVFKSSTKV